MSTPQFTVTFDRRSDDTRGLRAMELSEAQRLIEFAVLRGMAGARIIPVDHPSDCSCYLHHSVGCPIGTVVVTIHGNKLRRFGDGWSPLKGAHWDRWTVYTDAELAANFTLTG